MKQFKNVAVFAVVTGLAVTTALAQITIPTSPIGNAGNAADPVTGYGSVAYTYNIGRTEVTNAQYAAFLNAKAASDPNGLYHTSMAGSFGGITRSGSSGSYTYSTISGRENRPVNWVSFWDAARFANWMHNGQGSSSTETGAYTLSPAGISANTITRNAGWQWAVTSENEWYKAAFHQPASLGGDSDNFWKYPTSSNSVPTTAQANFAGNGINNTVPVGSYASNYYGTFDMGGNVYEWNEAVLYEFWRGIRGGAFNDNLTGLTSGERGASMAMAEETYVGFRVSQMQTTVPIGNPGNAADPGTGYGSVAYLYNIGRTEVTNAQYVAFLNAKAGSDPNGLYSIYMSGSFGGINRWGPSGSFTYSTVPGRENHPVNFVSFWDATRYANWLHNGQGSGDTETGAYTLTQGGISANTITRNAGWKWAVTSENEWYKAAFHQPASAGGDSDNFWMYTTSSNSVPTTAQANFGSVYPMTRPVGSYSPNYYGTFDMGGNVIEWNEAIIGGTSRGLRGGSFQDFVAMLHSYSRDFYAPTGEYSVIGFRVSQATIFVATGTVDFGQLGGSPYNTGTNLPTTIPVIFRDAAYDQVATGTATYNPLTGAFSANIPGTVTGPYRISFKVGFWLRKTMPNFFDPAAPLGNYNFGTVAPLVGDADDDNAITPSDFGLWQITNGDFVTENTGTDFDGDGAITPSDYGLWRANNGYIGDD